MDSEEVKGATPAFNLKQIAMDGSDFGLNQGGFDTHGSLGHGAALDHCCHGMHYGMDYADHNDSLIESLTVAHVANGMDPQEAVLQARLQAPLIQPLF
jgi:hypothetical protein